MQFFIRGKTHDEIIQLNVRLIEISPYGKFFVDHRHNECDPTQWRIGYAITEPQTGTMICYSRKMRDAVNDSVRIIKRKGKKHLTERISKFTSKYGILNDV